MGSHQFKELKVWQKSMELVEHIYAISYLFPKMEQFGLVSQMRRSSVSIPSNIAEGAGRNSTKDFDHFLSMANGSAYELETQLMIAQRLDYLSTEKLQLLASILTEITKMIFSLKKSLHQTPQHTHN